MLSGLQLKDEQKPDERPKSDRHITIHERPVCPVHGVPMVCGSSQRVRYYYCPCDGCEESGKVGRGEGGK